MTLNPPTLSDVAARAGVSLATASRALNGSVRRVKPDLYERVIATAKELGYSANVQAQAVARGRSATVALVVGDITDPYFAEISAGVMRVAADRGLIVSIASTGSYGSSQGSAREDDVLVMLRGQRPRAVVFAGTRVVGVPTVVSALESVAVIGEGAPGLRTVHVDNRGGASRLASALTEHGYRDFTILAGPHNFVTVRDRVDGFCDVAPGARVITTEFSREGGYRAMAEFLSTNPPPECVFAVTDVMALGAIEALREMGCVPGADVGVAGFGDIPVVTDITPALTSVALPLDAIGGQALELALAEGEEVEVDLIPAAVRLRASTPGVR